MDLLKAVNVTGYPGNYSLKFDLALDYLGLYVDGLVTLGPGSFVVRTKGVDVEQASLTLGLHELSLKLVLQLAISKEELEKLTIGQLHNNSLGCLLMALQETNATYVDAVIKSFDIPQISGFSGVSHSSMF